MNLIDFLEELTLIMLGISIGMWFGAIIISFDMKYKFKSGKATVRFDGKEYRVKFIEIKRKEIIEEVEN